MEIEMNRYLITVNGYPLQNRDTVEAKSIDHAVTKWIVEKYGSVMSSSAPYNVSAKKIENEKGI
jgi:hypothetical protein